jgi:hypothetical protein
MRVRSALLVLCLVAVPVLALADPQRVILMGDMPYGPPEESHPPFEALIGAINAAAPDLVTHVGDIKSGRSPCSDAVLAEQRAYLDSIAAPVLYTPGDNEWTDCHRAGAGGFDPRERLAHLRATFFDAPDRTLGARPLPLVHQGAGGYPENARLMLGRVMVMSAHVVGSNNGFEPFDLGAAQEARERDAANRAWLATSFAAARAAGAEAVILAIHADMFEFGFGPRWDPEGFLGHSGFGRFAEALIEETNRFGRPVLLAYGDSHVFRLFHPFPTRAPGIMALETFGAAQMHAVEIVVDAQAGYPFAIRPLINPAQPLAPR